MEQFHFCCLDDPVKATCNALKSDRTEIMRAWKKTLLFVPSPSDQGRKEDTSQGEEEERQSALQITNPFILFSVS